MFKNAGLREAGKSSAVTPQPHSKQVPRVQVEGSGAHTVSPPRAEHIAGREEGPGEGPGLCQVHAQSFTSHMTGRRVSSAINKRVMMILTTYLRAAENVKWKNLQASLQE